MLALDIIELLNIAKSSTIYDKGENCMKTLLTKNFFDDPFNYFFAPNVPTSSSMKTDVIETEKEIKLSINLAGFKKEEISLDLDKEILTISAKKQETETQGEYIRREMSSSCQRSYHVGSVNKDTISASFVDGILSIVIPKEQEKLDTKISIS